MNDIIEIVIIVIEVLLCLL